MTDIRLDGDKPLLADEADDTAVTLLEFNPYHDQRGRFASKNLAPAAALDALAAGGQPNVRPEDVGAVLDLAAQRSDHPDLTELHVSGTLKFGDDGMGIARADMPQLDARTPEYVANLRSRGIKVTTQLINPQRLKPTQKEVSATNTGKLLGQFRDGSMQQKQATDPSWRSIVSNDNFVLDGHHRWGAAVAYSFEKPGFKVPVTKVDMPMSKLLADAEAFTAAAGIAKKAMGEAARLDGDVPLIEANPYHDELGRFAAKTAVRVGPGARADWKTADGTTFSEGEVRAVRDWQSTFGDVDYIQSNWNDATAPLVSDFASAVMRSPVENGKVYRGIREKVDRQFSSGVGSFKGDARPEDVIGSWKARVGQTIQMKEPVSTSPSYNTAGRFGNTVFEIDHKGTAHDITRLSRYPEFPEAVMLPGAFKVTGVRIGPKTDYKGGRFTPFHMNPESPNLIVSVERVGDAT